MLRSTKQRRIIIEELCGVKTHPTADEVYRMVRRKLPRVSLATVYRNLELLSEEGKIMKLELAGKQRRYDANTERHYHVRCVRCGRVDDIPIKPFSGIDSKVAKLRGYEIVGHRLKFMGLCPGCRRRGSLSVRPAKKGRKEAGR